MVAALLIACFAVQWAVAKTSNQMKGQVIDAAGVPVVGALVSEKDRRNTVPTDMDGNFLITVQEPTSPLVVSALGYASQELPFSTEATKVVLQESAIDMEQVVVVGYQTMRKSDITGSVASVKAAELNLSAPTVGQALVGKVAGVQIAQVSGAPYASTKIRVRGTSSINASSDPLYVIDGYPSNADIFINPEDIESIEVLKDAASAAIYGSRASGGVILITTKRGREGKPVISYDFMGGVNTLSRKVDVLNADQFADLFVDARNSTYKDLLLAKGLAWQEAYRHDTNDQRSARYGSSNSGFKIPETLYDFATGKVKTQTTNTDWQNELYRPAFNMRHNLSISGGTEKVRYLISGGYQDQQGIMIGTGQVRFNFRSNIDVTLSKVFSVGANVSYTHTQSDEVQTGRFHQSPTMTALVYAPVFEAYNADGTPKKYEMSSMASEYGFQNNIENPIALANEIKNLRKTARATYNVFGQAKILPDLVAKISLGSYRYDEKWEYYRPTSLTSGTNAPYSPQAVADANAQSRMTQQEDYLAEGTLNYNYNGPKWSVSAVVGGAVQRNIEDLLYVTANGFMDDKIPDIVGGGADPSNFSRHSSTGKSAYSLVSGFGRVNVGFMDRYHLSASFRADGCSRFGPDNRWGYFPSVSAGWTLSKEQFYQDWFGSSSSLKLRASWGLSGNNNIGNYNFQQVMSNTGVVIGSSITTAMYPGGFRDNMLGWESTSQLNVGFDLSLFNGRLSVLANYYDSYTYNLLFQQSITALSGTTSMLTNLPNSKINNQGFDLQIDGLAVSTANFSLRLGGNISLNRNKVLDLGGAGTILSNGAERSYPTHITMEGQPIGMFWGYQVAGMVTEADMANLAIDDQYYDASKKSFPNGYQAKGPARSLAQTTKLQPGDLYFEDLNGDGVVDENDKQIIGNPHPDFTYGVNLTATWGNFDLSASFNGSQGNKLLDGQCYYLFNMEGSGNQYSVANERYRNASDPGNGTVYRASRGGTQSNSTRLSSFYLEDGSYFRCTNITLGYNWRSIAKMTNNTVRNIRFYVALDNPFTAQNYRGYNPEVDYGSGSNLAPGVDYGMYPLMSATNLGVKITF